MADEPILPQARVTGQRALAMLEQTYQDETKSLLEQLDAAVETCAKKARRYDAKAEITLKITFKPKDGKMDLAADLKVKVPQPGSLPLRLYTDAAGLLYDEDPHQRPLEFPKPAPAILPAEVK